MRVADRLAPIVLQQILPSGERRSRPLGSLWHPEPGAPDVPSPRAVVLVFLRHFG
ncbi:hypothetical protein KJ059_14900 [Myxococcota bacterium]|nr:hypothetical protein [Myxococcota bacterium]MCZ7617648.1 hypothetical protein [Myxococcota bacterium]